jgi:hypothetical protein
MRRLLVCLGIVGALIGAPLFHVPLRAAAAFVQGCGVGGNDATCTMSAGLTTGNTLLAVGYASSQLADRVTLTGITGGPGTDLGQGNVGPTYRYYGKCLVIPAGDSGDTTIIATTTGGEGFWGSMVELSGATCTEDAAEVTASDSASAYPISITTTTADAFILGAIVANTSSNYSAGTGTTSIPADGADVGGGDGVGRGLGGYLGTVGAAGSKTLEWTTPVGQDKTSVLIVFAVRASGAGAAANGPRCLLMGAC